MLTSELGVLLDRKVAISDMEERIRDHVDKRTLSAGLQTKCEKSEFEQVCLSVVCLAREV